MRFVISISYAMILYQSCALNYSSLPPRASNQIYKRSELKNSYVLLAIDYSNNSSLENQKIFPNLDEKNTSFILTSFIKKFDTLIKNKIDKSYVLNSHEYIDQYQFNGPADAYGDSISSTFLKVQKNRNKILCKDCNITISISNIGLRLQLIDHTEELIFTADYIIWDNERDDYVSLGNIKTLVRRNYKDHKFNLKDFEKLIGYGVEQVLLNSALI